MQNVMISVKTDLDTYEAFLQNLGTAGLTTLVDRF